MFRSWHRNDAENKTRTSRRLARRSRRRALALFGSGIEGLEQRVVLSFLAPVTYSANASPAAVDVADFNGDGKLDVITANTSPGTVNVLLNNGDGTFQAPISSSTSNNPVEVEADDIDGDGKQDIVTIGSYYTSAMSVMKGNGDGTFQAPVLYPMPVPPRHVQIEDLNGDGKPDLVLSNEFFNWVGVMMNNGTGSFSNMVQYTTGSAPEGVSAGDFNGDGKPDLVTPDMGAGGVNLFYGDGTGAFPSGRLVLTGSSPTSVTVGDFNGDGKQDIAVGNSGQADSVTVLLGNGDGTFGAPASYPVGAAPLDINTADFNTDGIPDLIERTSSGYAIEYGLGDGTFLAPEATAGAAGTATAIGDFNGDTTPDVASTNGGGTVTVLLNAANNPSMLAGAVGFQVTAASTSVAGAGVPVTVTAVDADGNPVTGFLGTVGISSNDPQAGGVVTTYRFTAADAGTHTFASGTKLYTVGTETVNVAAPLMTSASTSVTVTPSTATHLAIASPATALAGASTGFTVTALDAYGNVATGYTGTVKFTSTDGQAVLPPATAFSTADAGVKTVPVVLKTVSTGGQRINAVDTATNTITGASPSVTVTPAAASAFALTGGGGYIGSPHAIAVTAMDPYGNIATGYSGTVHITSSDTQAFLPADGTLANGVGTFEWTPMTLGTMSLTADDTADATIAGGESVDVTPGAATRYVVTPVGDATAGTTQSFTVTAYDVFGDLATDYVGTVVFGSSDLRAGLPAAYTFTAADAGIHTFNVAFRTAGTQSITVRDSVNLSLKSTQAGINVTPAAASSMWVTPLPGSTTAGAAIPVTVTLFDPYGNVATGYAGTVAFTSIDPLAVLPASYTFTAADAGAHTFNVVFETAEDSTIAIQDTLGPWMAYSQANIHVAAGPIASFQVKGAIPSNTVAGSPFNLTLMAEDAYGNILSGYAGTVAFGSSDVQAGLPADYTFTGFDGGVHTFSMALKTAGTQSITAQDTADASTASTVSGTGILVKQAAASTFAVSGLPSSTTAGVAQNLTVTATDPYGNLATGYTGTVTFSSSDVQAGLPASYTFTNKDSGVHTFPATLKTAGTQSVTLTDTANPALTATQSGIGVAASNTAGSFAVSGFPSTTAGVAQSFTVAVKDPYGNLATGYTGTVTFSSSDVQAGLPASYTFTAADAGIHTFSATLKTAGSQSITVKDAATPTALGSQTGISVSASNTPASFAVSGFPATTAGVAHNFTVTARDAYGNLCTGYTGTVRFSSSDVQAGLPASYTFTAADAGVHTFSATLKTAGTQSITVRDMSTSTIVGTQTGIAVTAAAARFSISTPSTVTQGVGFKFTLTVLDAFGNIATGYRGTVHLSSTDPKAGTQNFTFSGNDNGVHVFSYTLGALGSQTFTLTDTVNGALTASATVNVVVKG